MVAYCNHFISDLEGQIRKGEGEDWMVEAIRIETAIVAQLLKTENAGSAPVRAANFNEDYIGELIKQRVMLTHDIADLEQLCSNNHQRMVEVHYADKLAKRKEELDWTLSALREAKQRHKLHLQQRLATVDGELSSGLVELAEEQELRHLRTDLVRKIEIIDTELKQL